jgi:predicted pyridoxine 5'-phosphate oxidase superfamily flavin-nucleotide-binding protein
LLGDLELAFIRSQRSFYIALASCTGWPIVEYRRGPAGILKVPDPTTLAFADFSFRGLPLGAARFRSQSIIALVLVDYVRELRLTLRGWINPSEPAGNPALAAELVVPGYPGHVERMTSVRVAEVHWQWPEHDPVRMQDIRRTLAQPLPGAGGRVPSPRSKRLFHQSGGDA